MAQQNSRGADRTPRVVSDDLRMADAGRERVAYLRHELRAQLVEIHQQSAWMLTQLEAGTLRERAAAEQLASIEDATEDLSVAGEALAASARDRDVHLNDAVDRGLGRAENGCGMDHNGTPEDRSP